MMRSIICCVHWTLLLVSIISCSCLLALVVSCEGASKSIDGSSLGITPPSHPPSALPKTKYVVPSPNNANMLEEKETDTISLYLNGSSAELKTEVETSRASIDPDSRSHSVYSDSAQIKQVTQSIENVPVAEIHSSFEESAIENKQCVNCGQESEEKVKSKLDLNDGASSLGNGFVETKDASIAEPVVEIRKEPEEKQKIKTLSTPQEQVNIQIERPLLDDNDTDGVEKVKQNTSPESDSDVVAVSQTVSTAETKDSEQFMKVKGVESVQKETDVYIVRAEPKGLDAMKNDVPNAIDGSSKAEAGDKNIVEEKNGHDVKSVNYLSQDPNKIGNNIKVDGQESGNVKDELGPPGEHKAVESSSPTASDVTNELPLTSSSPSASEDMPSFSEWTQKRLEEAERRKAHNDTSGQGGSDGSSLVATHASGSPGGTSNGAVGSGGSSSGASTASGSPSSKTSGDGSTGAANSGSGGSKTRQKNYASPDCGAKIASSNPEAVSPGSVLSPSRDEYLLNACASRIWFVVELCEAIRAKKIELANFELFSSSPKEFSVWSSDRFPTRDWSLVGRFTAQDERTLQSFHLEPHLYAKFIRVELHSHYGSEHFCPVSLFRVYGTSEFEVLETEQDDGDNGVIRSGASSGSLGGEDDGEDSDEEEPLDIESSGPPRNLFGSARDAVLSIVKKAAEALVKAGDSANETITLATESPIKEVPKNESLEPTADGEEAESAFSSSDESASECRTVHRPPVCHGCEEATILRAAALLSCHYDTLRPLISSPFVRSALASGGICATRFGLPLSAANPGSSTPATDGGYLSALLPVEYLVALCNALITPDMVREPVILPDPPIQQPSYTGESQTISLSPDPHKQNEGFTAGDPSAVASMIKPTKTLKGDGVGSGVRGESCHDARAPEDESLGMIIGSSVPESPQSTSMPSLSSMTSGPLHRESVEASVLEEEEVADGSSEWVAAIKQDPTDSYVEWIEKDGDLSFHEGIEPEGMAISSPSTEPGVRSAASTGSTLSPVPAGSSHSLPSLSASAPSTQPPASEGGVSSQGTGAPGTKGSDDPNVLPPSPTTAPSKVQEAPSATPSSVPPTAVMQKESVFVRLSNRIKTLERNMSLSAQYLEELSRRYRKQFEEAQKQSIEAQKRDRRLAEDAANLQARLDVLAEAVKGLLEARKREEELKQREKEQEEARIREEQEYGEQFPWWGAILLWVWSATGRAAVVVAQHAAIFCVELMVLWAVMGHYQRRRWGWSGGLPSNQLEAESLPRIDGDVQQQLRYGSLRKRRKWASSLKEEDSVTETGSSPRKRKPTHEDIEIDGVTDSGTPSLELKVCPPQQKHRRRRRKLRSSSITTLSSFPSPVSFPSPDMQFSPTYPAVSAPPTVDTGSVETLYGWTWPCNNVEMTTQRSSVSEDDFVKPPPKDDLVSKAVSSGRSSPKNSGDGNKEVQGKTKPRRVSAPIFSREDSGTFNANKDAVSPLSLSSSQIHSSLRVCSPKLKGDNWEWFTGARVSGDLSSRGSRSVNRNGHSTLPLVDGTPEGTDGQRGNASPSRSSKSKDKKNSGGSGSVGSGSGGSSFKRIVKRFF